MGASRIHLLGEHARFDLPAPRIASTAAVCVMKSSGMERSGEMWSFAVIATAYTTERCGVVS